VPQPNERETSSVIAEPIHLMLCSRNSTEKQFYRGDATENLLSAISDCPRDLGLRGVDVRRHPTSVSDEFAVVR